MVKLVNAGGSLTLSAVVVAAVWGVRSWRLARAQRRADAAALAAQAGGRSLGGKYRAALSPAAVAGLLRLGDASLPHVVVDVRSAEQAAARPLPPWLAGTAVRVPEPQLGAALAPPHAAWPGGEGGGGSPPPPPPPTPRHTLVLLAADAAQEDAAAGRAAAAGFDRIAVVAGGLEPLLPPPPPPPPYPAGEGGGAGGGSGGEADGTAGAAAAGQKHAQQQQRQQQPPPPPEMAPLPHLHRDALALLIGAAPLPEEASAIYGGVHGAGAAAVPVLALPPSASPQLPGGSEQAPLLSNGGMHQQPQQLLSPGAPAQQQRQQQQGAARPRLLLLDVRRHDERALYGALPGAHALPADELASALALPPRLFRRRYRFAPPRADGDVLVLQSRAAARAVWAGQVARDAGVKHVYVYADGAAGWRLSPAVQAYPPYAPWQPPPEPEGGGGSGGMGGADVAAGVAELQALQLMELAVASQAAAA